MRIGLKIFLFLFVINFTRYSCERLSIIGSHLISTELNYTTLLLAHSVKSTSNVDVTVYDSEMIDKFDENGVEAIIFETPKNIHPTKPQVSVKVNGPRVCKEQSVDLIDTSKSPIVFIQFDKPIYKAGELFKFHVFVLDRKMLPLKGPRKISAYVTDANENKIGEDISLAENREFGVYEASFTVPERVTPGLWDINVQVRGRKVSKSFQVQQQQRSDDEIFIEMQDAVAFVDRKIYLILHTKEPSGRSANIHLAAKFENASIDEINMLVRSQDLKTTKTVFQLDFQEDLSIRFPTANMILKFTVQVVHAATGKKTTVDKVVRMRHKGRNTIQIVRKKFFKPGHKYVIKARVKTLDGKPDNSLNHLSTTIKFVTKNNEIEEKSYQTNLKNGEFIYSLQPKADTYKILISMEIADTKYSEEVSRFPGAKEYMLVSVLTKSPQVGSKVRIKVESTNEMEELHLVVFGSNGIVLHESFPDAIQKDIYEINMVVTNEMKPEARGLVFYSRLSDGALIYDEFSIGLGFSIENSLEITADATAEPDKMADIQVKTEKDSLVYLVAINANSPQINRDNEVSRSAIYDEITYYLNEKYPISPEYHFEKLNPFILEPLKNGTNCYLSSRSGIFDDENEQDMHRTKRSIVSVQKLYPEVLQEVKYIATTSEAQTIQLEIPDFTATWRIFGISVHPTKGFTVAKTQPEISVKGTVKQKLELELAGKTSIKQNEMHKIILSAVNVGPMDLRGTVWVTAEDGNLHVGNEVSSGNKKCINPNKESRLKFSVNLTPQGNIMSGSFYISANNLKQIKLKATFEGQINAETFKLIDVKDSLELKTNVIDTKLIESNQFDLVGLPGNTSSVATFVGIHGNLLGPALEGLDEIYGQIMYLDEEKILKFATDVIICKYFEYIRDSYHPKAIVARQRISESGPKVEDILKNTPDRKKNLGKLAFITGVLIDAIGYYDASKSISETLTFIKGEQYTWTNKGMYDYYPEFDDHKDISPTVRKYIQIASIVATMSKNPQVKQIYSNQISISLNYLNGRSIEKQDDYKGDHLNSMTAYAYALNGYYQNAAAFLQKLNHGYKKSNRFLKHYSMYVQALSYIILTKILVGHDPKEQIEWLLKYRNADGAYFSPYDTVLALQALYEYTKYKNYPYKQYVLRIDGNDTKINPSESAKYPLSDQNIKLQTYYQDLGYISLYQKYFDNTISRNTISNVETFVRKGSYVDSLDIRVDYTFKTTDRELGNSIIVLEVDLPVGYKHYNPKNEVVGYRNDETTLVFHFNNKAKNKKYDKQITVVRDPNVESYYKPLIIKFYDYYRPNIIDTYKYDVKCIIN